MTTKTSKKKTIKKTLHKKHSTKKNGRNKSNGKYNGKNTIGKGRYKQRLNKHSTGSVVTSFLSNANVASLSKVNKSAMNTNANRIMKNLKLYNQILIINNIQDYHETNIFQNYIDNPDYWTSGEGLVELEDVISMLDFDNVSDFYHANTNTLNRKEIIYIFKYGLFQFKNKHPFIIYAPSLKTIPNFRSFTPKKYFNFVDTLLKKNDTIPFQKSNQSSYYFTTDQNTKNNLFSFLVKQVH